MKNIIMALVVLGSINAFAEEGKNHPCKEVKTACEAAGFKQGEHKNKKGLWKDCVEPVMNGKSVSGVNVSSNVISACKVKKAEHHAANEKSQ
ncbi:MAG: hypothetical protein J7501_10205 [Bdellovibrio sp.]|nr:hypothetical protein [Bdellovibrio sp.]